MSGNDGTGVFSGKGCFGRTFAAPDPLLEVRSSALLLRSQATRDRRHQWRRPRMLCAISRPIPQPNPCTTDRMKSGALLGRKDRDRANGEAGEDQDSHKDAP